MKQSDIAGRVAAGPTALARAQVAAGSVSGHYSGQAQGVVLRLHGGTPRVVLEVEGRGAIQNHVATGADIALVPDVSIAKSERVRGTPVRPRTVHPVYGVAMRPDRLNAPLASRLSRSLISGSPDAGEAP